MEYEINITKALFPDHSCRDQDGDCVFCDNMNPDLIEKDLIAVPFDVPGYYDPNQEPNVVIKKIPGINKMEYVKTSVGWLWQTEVDGMIMWTDNILIEKVTWHPDPLCVKEH